MICLGLPWAGLEASGDPFPGPSSLPGQPFLQTIMPFPVVPQGGTAHFCKAQGFKTLDPFRLASNGGLAAEAQGFLSAGQPPTPDAIVSPHRLSGFRKRAPLRRSGNRPVRTVGRNGGVWYMMRNDCKTHVMMQCPAHA